MATAAFSRYLGPGAIWWQESLAAVFEGYPAPRRERCLRHIQIISEGLRRDAPWTELPEGGLAYQNARNWARSGRWDSILVLLHQAGQTRAWPERSLRWGIKPFNRMGYPNAGFFSIVSLAQARHYREQDGPSSHDPFPIRAAFRRADNWRSWEEGGARK